MSVNIPMNFDLNSNQPLDVRAIVNNLAKANIEIPLDSRYPGMIAYMKDVNSLFWLDGDMYTWHKLLPIDYDKVNDKIMEVLNKHTCCDVEIPIEPGIYSVKVIPYNQELYSNTKCYLEKVGDPILITTSQFGSDLIGSYAIKYILNPTTEGKTSLYFHGNADPNKGIICMSDITIYNSTTDTECMFNGCSNLRIVKFSDETDVSNVTNMNRMFKECKLLTKISNIANWNTSSVKNMYAMFLQCNSITDLDISNWDTSSVTNMSYMFYECSSITKLDLSKWDVSKVTNVGSMFYLCSSLTSLNISGWDLSGITSTYGMFSGCTSLTRTNVIMDGCNDYTKDLINKALNAAGIS